VSVPDLIAALECGRLGGAALDVYPEEPPPVDSPLFRAKNVLLAPHIASSTNENMTRIGVIAERLIGEFAAGKL
jgi:phosphoglycerate dehydrogenase-like enzyme